MYGQPPNTIGYEAICRSCDETRIVPIVESAVERDPWRLVWRCVECDRVMRTLISRRLAARLTDEFDRAYGTRISIREARAFRAGLDEIERAFADECV